MDEINVQETVANRLIVQINNRKGLVIVTTL